MSDQQVSDPSSNSQSDPARAGFGEFVALMALIMCLVALSIDAMLPALDQMGVALNVAAANDIQLVISVVFLGVATGQLIYGPLADAKGRKPTVYLGFALFILGTLFSLFAQDLQTMLVGRFLQGLGAAGPRIVTVAIVRDQYKGKEMARVMSLIMTIFILCPVVAPLLGQGVLLVAGWREIFGLLLALALIAVVWFGLRQHETLLQERRIPISAKRVLANIKEVIGQRAALSYMIALGFVFGAFIGFLSSIQQVLQGLYDLGAMFPVYFAVLAISIGTASYTNSRLVMRFGMRSLALTATSFITAFSLLALPLFYVLGGVPPLWLWMAYLLLTLFCVGLLFGNLNAMSMEPFGHIAGMASAIVGAVSTFIAVSMGTVVGQLFDGTVLPIVGGFALLGGLALFAIWRACRDCEKPVTV